MEKVMCGRGRGLDFAKETASDTQKDRLKVTRRIRMVSDPFPEDV